MESSLSDSDYSTAITSIEKSGHELTIEIPENLETTELNDVLCIYNVPPSLRQINSSAYTPQVISIGPIHHHDSLLNKMRIQKLRYFTEFCKRRTLTHQNQQQLHKQFATDLLNQIDEDEIRRCYASDSYQEIPSKEFVNLILLDSVFIIELFLRSLNFSKHQNDFLMGKPWLRTDVQKDLILLENQIPFSILDKIYNFAKKTIKDDHEPLNYPPFLDLTCAYFHNYKPKKTPLENPKTILHFTDLVRYFWSHKHPNQWPGTIKNTYSITKLHQAGLKLKAGQEKCFLDMEYKAGFGCLKHSVLEIPCFEVDDTTEFVVRNLMALEQCHYPDETYICNYIRLLDLLIDTAEDVELLVGEKILANGLGDGKAVADLVNKLCNQIVEDKSCYYTLATQLNGYYESCGNHTLAKLSSMYFGDLWRGTGTIAAIVLLILTFIQAACSIVQIYDSDGSP